MNFIEKEAGVAGLRTAQKAESKVVNLGLQGGGSHGAFTWGVLDRLLEEKRLKFEGITASSAGAVNATVLADGLTVGGREAAREVLRRFWKRMSEMTSHGMLQPSLLDRMNGKFGLEHSPGYLFMDALSYFTSPYVYNPLNYNPLRIVLEEIVDFERLRRHSRGQVVSGRHQCPHRQGQGFQIRGDRSGPCPRLDVPAAVDAGRSRSTAKFIGTAAMPEIRCCFRWSMNARLATSSWFI